MSWTSTRTSSKFAKKHDIIGAESDLAYTEIYFDKPPPSILQVEGAKDIAVEVTSMSKTYAMAGWRVGFAAGNERLIAALARVKSYLDYGAFTPSPGRGCAAALNGPQDCVDEMRESLPHAPQRDDRKLLSRRLGNPGAQSIHVRLGADPGALPRRPVRSSSRCASSRKRTSPSPPAQASASMETTIVRLALVENEQRIRQAARNVRKFLEANGVKVPSRRNLKSPPRLQRLRRSARRPLQKAAG